MRTVKYRGIAGVVRRAVNNGAFVGEITPDKVRHILPPEKSTAPDNVIINSLRSMADKNEILSKDGRFYPKTASVKGPAVSVSGELKSLTVNNGVTTAVVEVTDMKYL